MSDRRALCREFLPLVNPRTEMCARCGRPQHAHPPAPSPPVYRSPEFEQQWLEHVSVRAAGRHGLDTAAFIERVQYRLRVGQERYGNQFRTANLPREICEEAEDAAAYAVLDAQKRIGCSDDPAAAWHLYEIGVLAATLHAHARALLAGE